jgi:hypothetical protein
MNIDLKKFKKIQHTQSTTTLQHPDGHKIKVAHAGLDEKTKKQLGELPMHYAHGGQVLDDETSKGAIKPANIDRPDGGWGSITGKAEGGMIEQQPGDDYKGHYADGSIPQGPSAPMDAIPQQDPNAWSGSAGVTPNNGASGDFGMPNSEPTNGGPTNIALPNMQQQPQMGMPGMGQSTSGLGMQMQGIKQQANAEGALGKQQAAIEQEHQKHIQQIAIDTQANAAKIDQDTAGIIADMRNGHINPSHYMDSKSSLGKVSTAIGLILGGIGGGLTHQENPALKFLMSNIEKDVEAQKANMSNKNTLLAALEKQYGNRQDALKMLHSVYLADTESKLKEAAAKSADPIAQARALQASGPILQAIQANHQDVAFRQAIAQGVNNGMDPALAVVHLVPKEHQNEVFHEIEKAKAIKENGTNILGAFDSATKDNTVLGTIGRAGRDSASETNFMNLMMPILKDKEGRINETEIKMMHNFVPKPGEGAAKIAEKRQGLVKFLQDAGSGQVSLGHGIDLSKFKSTSPSSNSKFKPAR